MNLSALPSLQFVRNTLLSLPETTEKLHFGTPAFYVNKKIIARLKEDDENWVVYTEEREKWMKADPATFYISPHYDNYKFMLVNIENVDPDVFKELLLTAWGKRAPKRSRIYRIKG